jgi:hypothetical protein
LSIAYEPLKTVLKKEKKTMKRNWMAMLVIAGGLDSAMFGQQYPQQYPSYQGDPNYNGQDRSNQYDNGQYSDGQYSDNQSFGAYNGGPAYNGSDQGVDAPAPPPMPNYAYQRPPMPGPGYYWVDGNWNFIGGRYSWVAGYWTLPPFAGGYWTAPRYYGGRFFRGSWGGGRRDFDRGFSHNDYRYQERGEGSRQIYRGPAQSGFRFRGGDNRGASSGNRGHREGRH